VSYRILATPTANSASINTFDTSSIETTGLLRHCAILSVNDRLASKNSGS
jgi:hypothetical protein